MHPASVVLEPYESLGESAPVQKTANGISYLAGDMFIYALPGAVIGAFAGYIMGNPKGGAAFGAAVGAAVGIGVYVEDKA